MHHGHDGSSACLDGNISSVIYKACVCVCEVSAGCENEDCTVEFRRPEAKGLNEMRWTTLSFAMRREHELM